jgi:hypothetical protein
VQINFLLVQARCGQHQEAAGKADQLRGQVQIGKNPHLLYHLACVYTLCSAAAPKADLGPRYQDAAIRTLRQAMALGWKNAIDLQTDPDLEALRSHPDYASLLAELQPAPEQDRQQSQAK